ncbi:hypothetical protein D3C83_166870 [compost metagenome]
MGGKRDGGGPVELGEHVETAGGDRLLRHPIPAAAKIVREPPGDGGFAAGRGIDVDETAGQGNRVNRI